MCLSGDGLSWLWKGVPLFKGNKTVLEELGISLPLPGQATTTMEDRLEKGIETQAEIFGAGMREAWKENHIRR